MTHTPFWLETTTPLTGFQKVKLMKQNLEMDIETRGQALGRESLHDWIVKNITDLERQWDWFDILRVAFHPLCAPLADTLLTAFLNCPHIEKKDKQESLQSLMSHAAGHNRFAGPETPSLLSIVTKHNLHMPFFHAALEGGGDSVNLHHFHPDACKLFWSIANAPPQPRDTHTIGRWACEGMEKLLKPKGQRNLNTLTTAQNITRLACQNHSTKGVAHRLDKDKLCTKSLAMGLLLIGIPVTKTREIVEQTKAKNTLTGHDIVSWTRWVDTQDPLDRTLLGMGLLMSLENQATSVKTTGIKSETGVKAKTLKTFEAIFGKPAPFRFVKPN